MNASLPSSVTRPVSPAIERMKRMLFRPFDFSKWLAIGFCSWLAGLGEGSGGGHFNTSHSSQQFSRDLGQEMTRIQHYLLENLSWIIPMAVLALLLILGLVVLLQWLGSRGSFMFLDCVVRDRGEVAAPWREYRREGNSLLLFRLITTGCGMVLILAVLALFAFLTWKGVAMGWTPTHHPKMPVGMMAALCIGLTAYLLVFFTLIITLLFTNQFVVPIMYLRRCTCTEAWGEFLGLLKVHSGSFVRYLLFQIVIAIVVGLIVLAAILCTCCLGLILLVLPVAGSVFLLPVSVFWRNYSLLYLAQFGPEYDLLRGDPPALP